MTRLLIYPIAILLFASISAFGQKEFNHWLFDYGSVDFNQTPPSGSNIIFGFGSLTFTSVTVSDKNSGQLLFYNNGRIRNRFAQPMINGQVTTHLQHNTFYLPFPNSNSLYGIFQEDVNDLYYEIVDMNLNGGLGEVVPNSHLHIYHHNQMQHCISGYKQVNNESFWLITVRKIVPEISSFIFNENGLDTVPTIYHVPGHDTIALYQSKLSPNGKKFAYTFHGKSYGVAVFDYDRRTSSFSNPIYIPADTSVWGVEFSPNSKLLYYTLPDSLYQVNITKHDSTLINQSKQTIKGIPFPFQQFGQIQLGPDRAIYLSIDNHINRNRPATLKNYLSKIEYPDSIGPACNFVDTGVLLTGQNGLTSGFALPDIHASFFRPLKFENACEGQAFKVTITDTVSLDSAKYDFGNPSSGSRNFGFGVSDTHTYSSSGQFLLTTIMYYTDLNGGVQIDSLWDSIYVIPSPRLHLLTISDTVLCKNDSLFASVKNTSDYNLFWYDSTSAPFHSFDSSGTYWLKAINRCGVDSVNFNVTVLNRSIKLRPDTVICLGDSIQVSISDTLASFRWSNGSLDSSIWVSSSGKHWGEMTNLCGTFSDTLQVFVDAIPSPDLGLDTSVCKDALLFFSAAASAVEKPRSYLWNTGDTFSQVIVKSPGLHWVQVTNECGVGSDSVLVSYLPPPSFSITPDSAFCSGDSIQVSFSGLVNHAGVQDNPSLLWSNGSSDSTIWVKDFGWVTLQLTNQCGVSSDSILVTELPKPTLSFPEDTILCGKAVWLLDVSNSSPRATYLWQDNSSLHTYSISSPGTYSVTVTNPCGLASEAIRVAYQNEPTLELKSEPNNPVCEGTEVLLSALASGGGLSYLWSTGDTSKHITTTYSGTYSLSVTNQCGVSSASIAAPFVTLKADFSVDNTEGEAPLNIVIQNASVGAETYEWFLDSVRMLNFEKGTWNHEVRIIQYGKHTLMVVAKNGQCSDTALQEVEVLKNSNLPPRLCDFDIRPNPVLTGLANDAKAQQFFLVAQNNDKQVREIKIYNAAGAIVYQTDVSHWKENPFFWQSPRANLNLASGTYTIGLVCENETVYHRLVVE